MYCETMQLAPSDGGCQCSGPSAAPTVLDFVGGEVSSARGAPWWLVLALLALALGGR